MEFPTGDEFQWGEVGEGLVRAHAVVGVFPLAELMIESGWLVGVGVYLVELFMVGACGVATVEEIEQHPLKSCSCRAPRKTHPI